MNAADQFDVATAHTPGPWVWNGSALQPQSPDHTKHQVRTILFAEFFAQGFVMADTKKVWAEDDANRLLIAAAPELLDALKAFVKYAVACNDDSHELDKAHSAIAKATGVPT